MDLKEVYSTEIQEQISFMRFANLDCHYYSSSSDDADDLHIYKNQPCEQDAFRFADWFEAKFEADADIPESLKKSPLSKIKEEHERRAIELEALLAERIRENALIAKANEEYFAYIRKRNMFIGAALAATTAMGAYFYRTYNAD